MRSRTGCFVTATHVASVVVSAPTSGLPTPLLHITAAGGSATDEIAGEVPDWWLGVSRPGRIVVSGASPGTAVSESAS